MKRIVFWEYDGKDIEKMEAKRLKVQKEREEHPAKFPKTLFPPHMLLNDFPKLTKEFRGFSIVESDDPQQTINIIARWMPELSFKSIPIVEGEKVTATREKFKE